MINPEIWDSELQKDGPVENQYRHADRPQNRVSSHFSSSWSARVFLRRRGKKKTNSCMTSGLELITQREKVLTLLTPSLPRLYWQENNANVVYDLLSRYLVIYPPTFWIILCFVSPARDWGCGKSSRGDRHATWAPRILCAAFRLLPGYLPADGVHRFGRGRADETT